MVQAFPLNASNSRWGEPVVIKDNYDDPFDTSFIVVNGYPAISYYDTVADELKYVRATDILGQHWNTPITIRHSPVTPPITWYTLAVVEGHPAIFYYDVTKDTLNYVPREGDMIFLILLLLSR